MMSIVFKRAFKSMKLIVEHLLQTSLLNVKAFSHANMLCEGLMHALVPGRNQNKIMAEDKPGSLQAWSAHEGQGFLEGPSRPVIYALRVSLLTAWKVMVLAACLWSRGVPV